MAGKTGNLYYWVANWNLSRSQAALLLNNAVADLVDMTHTQVNGVRDRYYKLGVRRFAGYITGSSDIRWTPEDFKSFPEDVSLWSIDQSNQDLPTFANAKKVVDDQEPGAKTVDQTVTVAEQRLTHGDDLIVYVSQSRLIDVEDAMRAKGLPHGTIIAYQYRATPTEDLSVVVASHMPLPQSGGGVKQDSRRAVITVTDDVDEGWSVSVKPIPLGVDTK